MPFEILHGALVLLGGGAAVEGTEIAASAGLRIYFARIEPVFAGRQFADHWRLLRGASPPNIMARAIIIADKAVLFSRARRARAMSNSAFCLPPPPLAVTRVGEPSNPERDVPSCCGATLCGSPPANKGKRNAGRRVVHDLYASGAQGAPRRRRLAPPFRFGRARLPAFHHGTCGSDRTPPLSSSSRTSWNGATEERVLSVPCRPSAAGDVARRPVIVPAGRFLPGAARERG